MTGISQNIVTFISHLLPLYVEEAQDGFWCARSLNDGTLIIPIDEPAENQNGFVMIHWQGDAARQSIIQGTFVASYAVAKYVELHGMGENGKNIKAELRHLARHFTFKTGETLVFEMDDEESEFIHLLGSAVNKIGQEAVFEILKKMVGL